MNILKHCKEFIAKNIISEFESGTFLFAFPE